VLPFCQIELVLNTLTASGKQHWRERIVFTQSYYTNVLCSREAQWRASSYCNRTDMNETTTAVAATISDSAWVAIQGAYDLHVHVAPDVIVRRIDDIELAREFLARGLAGFVLKSHYVSTAERAKVVQKAVPGIAAFGALTLNHSVGGLNPVAVEIAGRAGAKIVWMPTVDASNETAGEPGSSHEKLPFWAVIQRELAEMGIAPPRMSVLDSQGSVLPAVRQCMDLIGRHDMILATGHLGRNEIFALVKAAQEMKLRKIIVTHPEFPSQNLSGKEQLELADLGAIMEHCFTTFHTGKATWSAVIENIRKVGPERCVLSTDLGQPINPRVSDGFAMFADQLLAAGFKALDIRRMSVENPAALLA
jgi:Family of unknown function (DUF6282)